MERMRGEAATVNKLSDDEVEVLIRLFPSLVSILLATKYGGTGILVFDYSLEGLLKQKILEDCMSTNSFPIVDIPDQNASVE